MQIENDKYHNIRFCDKCFVSIPNNERIEIKKEARFYSGSLLMAERIEEKDRMVFCKKCGKELWKNY